MTEATYDYLKVVKELLEYVGADYESAMELTIKKNGTIEVVHVLERKPEVITQVREYDRIKAERDAYYLEQFGGTA